MFDFILLRLSDLFSSIVDILLLVVPELGTLEWDTFNPDCLIRIFNVGTYNFLLNQLFFGYSTEKSKNRFFKIRESLQFLKINLK